MAADEENHKTPLYLTKDEDALLADWLEHRVWMQPPYGRGLVHWVKKAGDAADRGATVVGLIPNATDASWFHRIVVPTAAEVRLVYPRLEFIDPSGWKPEGGNTTGSMAIVWRPCRPSGVPARILCVGLEGRRMTWVKLDDATPWAGPVRAVSVPARWTYVAARCLMGKNLTDGQLLRGDLTLVDGTLRIAKELVAAGLWEPTRDGWRDVDYLTLNRSAAQVAELSESRRERGAKGLARRYGTVPSTEASTVPEKPSTVPLHPAPPNARFCLSL